MVSIHAPVRGATQFSLLVALACVVSIHAPVRGATQRGQLRLQRRAVSIHAPVRGATRRYAATQAIFFSFNPRAREGRDILIW